MLLAHLLSRPMLIYSVAVIMQLTRPRITTIFPGSDYVEEDHGLQTIQQNFTVEHHGKGSYFHINHFSLLSEFSSMYLCSIYHIWFLQEFGMLKEGKPVQKVQRCMTLKSTLHMIFSLSLSSIIHNQQILAMKLCTKSTSANSTIFRVEPFWHPILAGEHCNKG